MGMPARYLLQNTKLEWNACSANTEQRVKLVLMKCTFADLNSADMYCEIQSLIYCCDISHFIFKPRGHGKKEEKRMK